MNLQVPPNLAASVASALPLAGANDWGGVSPVTLDHVNPEKAWPSIPKLRRITEGCGLELRQRLPVYPEYVVDKPEFIPEALKPTVLGLVDGEGYVRREKEAG
jgi:2-iminoacetate synthase ThiH